MASVLNAARTLGEISGWSLSNLQMQKILYIAQMLHIGRTGRPMFSEDFEAWDFGPVAYELYRKAKIFGSRKVSDVFFEPKLPLESAERSSILSAYQSMRDLTPGQMVALTHRDNGAWAKCYRPGERGRVIPKELILQEYKDISAKNAPA